MRGHYLKTPHQQTFSSAAAWQTPAEQSRSEDACVVDNEEIAGAKKRRQLAKLVIGKRTRRAVHDE
jgi:hypothetical protein